MEPWKQCGQWLISCKVLPPNHRVTWDTAQVFDLAQTLRDGVLLCQLLNNLRSHSINLKEINLRPQMSQFLCLKNIRTFLSACCEIFGMKKSELFEAFDLFDVRDFGKKVKPTVNGLQQETALEYFINRKSTGHEEKNLFRYSPVYGFALSLLGRVGFEILQAVLPVHIEVEKEERRGVIETLSKLSHTPIAIGTGIRPFPTEESVDDDDVYKCLPDLIDETGVDEDEELYDCVYGEDEGGEVYEDLMKDEAAQQPDLVKIHRSLTQDISDSIINKNDQNLYQIFINYKERLVIYGQYCSQVETAISCLDNISKTKEDVKLKLEELVKHTTDPMEKANLKLALDAMKDLAQYVNEVKRDNETLREIRQFQLSIENLNHSLLQYGRPQGDGEIRITTLDKRARQDRHIFLFDLAVIVCKRRGDNYEMKEIIDLQKYKITNNPTTDKENKKWSYGFYLIHIQGQNGLEVYCKTKDLKKKWLEQFQMALSNIRPDYADTSFHEFKMHTFSRVTSCKVCQMLLRNGRMELEETPDTWTQGRNLTTGELGFFPSDAVKPSPCVPKPVDYSSQLWFAGAMERLQAESELINRVNSTYLVRHRTKESGEYAISIKYNNEVKHIKILTRDGFFHIAENRKFKNLMELVDYYKHHSLKEGFRSLDTTLQFPYKESENSAGQRSNRAGGNLLSPKVIGIAIARYDFCARDMRELSLLKGDVVKIYTKMSANGWWRGEVNGRVGWFPSTYVEEDE
ncbi:UNVERIFIED_CONTAM: hypothetical protein H355_007040 [Colinus virginianus]|nr:hypothetical protein H355_007040 [Colinus virginianus]